MIVKDEEDCISDCLKSVRDIVDELIIVDTGSTDRSIDICKSFGCRVVRYTWDNHFAKARNFGLSKATGDWIMWLDADEILDNTNLGLLKEALKTKEYDIYSLKLINYYGSEVSESNYSVMTQVRLFRNGMGLTFKNKIHETLNLQEKLKSDRLGMLDVKIYHFGYLDHVVQKKQKSSRNTKILEEDLKLNDSGWTRYYLAAEYYRTREYTKALGHVNFSIVKFIQEGQMPISMLYKLKYSILTDLRCWDEASKGINNAILLYPDYVDLWFYKGLALYKKGATEEAMISFKKCIELGEENPNYYIVKGVGSFQAWYYIGLCNKHLGQTEDAIIALLKSLSLSPEYTNAKISLQEILKKGEFPLDELINKHIEKDKQKRILDLITSS